MPPTRLPAELYRYTVDPGSDAASAWVWRFIGDQRRVLDLGAGPGSIARSLITDKGCLVTAVDVDAECVDVCSGFCERAARVDLNEADWLSKIPAGPYDAVILADVLEHLYDPWAVLDSAKRLLAPEGALIVSLPHAGHASLITCLLKGTFRYSEWGLLDRTHLRFFGMKNIQELVAGAGLSVIDAEFVMRRPEETEFADLWATLSDEERSFSSASRFAGVYQVVLKAVPSERATEARSLEDFLERSKQERLGLAARQPDSAGVNEQTNETRLDVRRFRMTSVTYGEKTGDYVDCVVGDIPLRMVFNNFHVYPTSGENLTILKSPPVLERQVSLLTQLAPKSILEFGIFEGGSAILWPQLLNAKYCGVDLRAPNTAIYDWVQRYNLSDRVSLNFRVSQSDEEKIVSIVNDFFGAEGLDLVIDDASHNYELSRRTFEITFPLLKPGAVYLLEDWPWAHADADFWQKDKYMGDQPALTNLIFQIVMLFGSCPHLISKIEIFSNFAVIYKSLHKSGGEPLSFDKKILKQDRIFTPF